MKKIISILLCAAMLAGVLCGCGKDKPSQTEEPGVTTRHQFTAPTRPQKTQPENTTTPQATTTAETTPADSPAQQENTKLFTFEDISLEVPESFEDVTAQLGMDIQGFVLGNDEMMVVATAESASGLDYYKYAQIIAATNGTSSKITDHGDYATFTYEVGSMGLQYRYVVGCFSSGDHNWLVQAYSQKKDFEKYEAILTAIVHSVKLDAEKASSDDTLTKKFTYEELSLYMPEEFGDMSQQGGLDSYDFVVGINDAAICAARNDGVGYSYLDYAKLVASATDNSGQVTDHGGYATFEYQASGYGMDFAYIVGIFPSGDQMWIVQAYCQTKDVQRWKATLEAIIHSVEIDEDKTNSKVNEEMVPYTYEEVTIQVPSSLKEDKAAIEGSGFSFCLSSGSMAVVGLCEDVSGFGELTEEEYVDLMIQANNLDATVEKHNGHSIFIYNGSGMYKDYTYMGCSYKRGSEFWTIQAYTNATSYAENKDLLIQIITSAEFD